MLKDVLYRVAGDTGYDVSMQRSQLLNLVQQAADKIFYQLDCTKIKREVTLAVQPDAVVSLPAYIGEVKGLRMHTNELPFDLHSIGSPRYVTNTLGYKFKNWRDIGESAVEVNMTVGQVTIQSNVVEDVTLYVSGQTNIARNIEEQIVLNAETVQSDNAFVKINKIASSNSRTGDIDVLDISGTKIATLFNDQFSSRYKMMDVSQVFWTLDTNDGESYIDVLYKLPKKVFNNDSDNFYAGDDYDDAWYWKAMELFYQPLEGKELKLQQAKTEYMTAILAIKDATEGSQQKKLNFGRNRFYNLFKKYRYYPGSVTNVDHNTQ